MHILGHGCRGSEIYLYDSGGSLANKPKENNKSLVEDQIINDDQEMVEAPIQGEDESSAHILWRLIVTMV